MTKRLYLENTYLYNFKASILSASQDERGVFIILDQTAFYPQGGGQPSDVGIIYNDKFNLNVTFVKQVENEIRHYIEFALSEINIKDKVNCLINKERRILNSKYHTAAHLIGNIVEFTYENLKAIKGHSFPYEAYIDFQGEQEINIEELQNIINNEINKNHNTKCFDIKLENFEKQFYKLPYTVPANKNFRCNQIGSFLPVPCGGTHLSSVKEIGSIKIIKIKNKKDIIRILFEVL